MRPDKGRLQLGNCARRVHSPISTAQSVLDDVRSFVILSAASRRGALIDKYISRDATVDTAEMGGLHSGDYIDDVYSCAGWF